MRRPQASSRNANSDDDEALPCGPDAPVAARNDLLRPLYGAEDHVCRRVEARD
jgi:hypothetical protein